MNAENENAPEPGPERPGKTDGTGYTRGLQNITNQLNSVNLKATSYTKPSSSTAASSVDGSWLVGKKGYAGQSKASSVHEEDTMGKYALAQPPSGAHLPSNQM